MLTEAGTARPLPWWAVVLVGRSPKRTLVRIGVLVAVTFLLFRYGVVLVRIQGPSMLPTYRHNEVRLVNRLAYCLHEPRRGDVVAIRMIAGPHVMLLKRVVGFPGETVAFHDGCLLINGQVLDEPYVRYPYLWEKAPVRDGPDEFYVVGDNRTMPINDHDHGQTERNLIVGKLVL